MKKIQFFILAVCLGFNLYAQSKAGHITGVVKDSVQQPLLYATITLARPSQPLLILQSTYTNAHGQFQFTRLDTGKYLLNISHTGYANREENITISDNQRTASVTIIMTHKTGDLKNITVEGLKPLVEQEADKVIYNAEADPMAKTETAMDILRKTPFVSVDGDDNVQVNGKSNFKVLLNGRESSLFAQNVKEVLKGFPGATIVKIEVITSPSAKYDAEGIGGIINIITKKKTKGYNGSVGVTYLSTGRTFYNVNLSAKTGKWGFTLSHFLNIGKPFEGTGFSELIPLVPAPYTRREEFGYLTREFFGNYQNIEVAYELDSLNSLSAYGNLGIWNGNFRSDDIVTTEFPSSPSTYTGLDFFSEWREPGNNMGLDYIRKFSNNKEKEFSIRINREHSTGRSYNSSITELINGDRYSLDKNKSPNNQYTIQSDYILPLKKGKLESGGKIIFRKAGAENISLIKYSAISDYQMIPGNNDEFNYRQNVYSVYSSYNFKIKKANYRIGLRVEHTKIAGDFVSSATKVKQEYTSFIPNLQATFKPTQTYSLVISYSKRLSRPYIWNLNPFINYNDSLNISFGNPNLEAQITHSFALQNRFQKGSSFFGFTLTGSYSNNSIVYYSSFDEAKAIVSNTSGNLGKDLQLTLNANVNTKFTPDWSFSLNGNLTYNRISNKYAEEQVGKGIGGNGNLNTIYTFTKLFSISGNIGFWRGPVTYQTTRKANKWYSLGGTYKMFKEKLSAGFTLANFLRKDFKFHSVTKDPYFIRSLAFEWPYRNLRLNLNYRFGKLKEGVSKKKGVSNDDLMGKESN